ncbi:MAG: enoyl-CoA hydratase-related protein [Bacteroidota bacterium]
MEYKQLKPDIQNGIAMLTISRPEAMNALNTNFFVEMSHFLGELKKRNDVRVLVITGEGKAFVAGADIAEMSDMNSEQGYKFSKFGQDVFLAIEQFEIPVIAAINGFCLGGGNELAMACDMRIASTKAKFGQPEVNLGLIPGYAGAKRLTQLAGLGNALYLILSAEMITADEALRMGLVQKVVEPEQLMTVVMELATKIAAKGPVSVKRGKVAIRKGYEMGLIEASEMEAKEFGNLFGNGESGEGMKAFLEKRAPNW